MPVKKIRRPFRVLILIPTSAKSLRDWLQGILRYAKWNGPWDIRLVTDFPNEQQASIVPGAVNFDGLIGCAANDEFCDILVKSAVPTLVIEPQEFRPDFPVERFHILKGDTRSAGEVGAEFFLGRHFEHFAFVHDSNLRTWSLVRGEGFTDRIHRAGYECDEYFGVSATSHSKRGYDREHLQEWLMRLPKPVALMGANDFCGHQVIETCSGCGLVVPDEIAVLGVDNDPLLCEASRPTLSSLIMNDEDAGYRGGELLDRLMKGSQAVDTPVLILSNPGSIVHRESTLMPITNDKSVVQALEYIRLNMNTLITISDIASHVGVSRRSLELRFRKSLKTSVCKELLKMRLEKVCFLLKCSDYSIVKIAHLSGFQDENYLSRVFKKEFQVTMSQFRELSYVK